MEMQYNKLGKSGLQVSRLSLGSWLTFGKQIGDETAEALMDFAYEQGINFFDNAEIYARGKSEQVMGAILKKKGWSRDSYIVSSKAFFGIGGYTAAILIRDHGWSPGYTFYAAAIIAFIVGCLIAMPVLRIRGAYLALVTLAVAVLFPTLLRWKKLEWLTSGAKGIDSHATGNYMQVLNDGHWQNWPSTIVAMLHDTSLKKDPLTKFFETYNWSKIIEKTVATLPD